MTVEALIDHIDDRAFGHLFARAMLDRIGKKPFDLRQVGDLGADLLEVLHRNLPNCGAAGLARPAQVQDYPHLVRREAEIAGTPDKSEDPDVSLVINPVPAFGPGWRREDADALEVSDRLDVHAGAARQFAARNAASATCGCHDDFA